MKIQLERRNEDLTKAMTTIEFDSGAKATFQKQIRDTKMELDDLNEDLKGEREARKHLENEKRKLTEENELLRNEIFDTADVNQEILQREKRVEEELSTLKQTLLQINKDHEMTIDNLRSKHAREMEELTRQLENTKRQVQTYIKDLQTLRNDNNDRESEIKNLNSLKQDIERKRRQLEAQVQDLQHKYNESERIKNEINDKSKRYQQNIEGLNTAYIEVEQRLQESERTISMAKYENQELQASLQDENRQKINLLSKLRQTEDLIDELKDQLDEKEEINQNIQTKSIQMKQENDELRSFREQVEHMKELCRQLEREKDALLQELDNEKLINSKLSKSNKKLTNDITDLNVELQHYGSAVQDVEKIKRTHDKQIQDEKKKQEKLRQERDQYEKELREKEAQRLNLVRELNERNYAFEDLDKRYKQLRASVDEKPITDDVGRYIHELEKTKRNLGKKEKILAN